LHLHWGQALDKLGDHAQALEHYREAQELALSDADKQILARYVATGSH
jgi:tetratricopeptide (TPR) repeat protein